MVKIKYTMKLCIALDSAMDLDKYREVVNQRPRPCANLNLHTSYSCA